MAHTGRGYSPGLDGVRGVFVVGFIAYHFGISELAGMWVVINHFFILSGFLIVRLLVQEYERYGDIDVLAFYRRRIRRLLPALLVVLAFVGIYGAFFAEGGQRRKIGGDMLATLGYVMNWRLIAQGDEYFGDQGAPSPLRHAWTLAIEEQFYLAVPVLIIVLFAVVGRRRRSVVVGALVAGSVLAVAWTWSLGFPDQASHGRVYYGTDARAQSLFLGAALGAWRARSRYAPWRIPKPLLEIGGVLGFVGSVACFWFVTPYTAWMYSGPGQLVFGLASAALILACADSQPSVVNKVFSWEPFAWVGRRTYGLYLWHWPIFVAVAPMLGSSIITIFVVCLALTFVAAELSFRYLETPILARGIRGVLPRTRRPLTVALTPIVVIALASFGLAQTAPPSQAEIVASDHAPASESLPDLVPGQPNYRPDAPARIGVHGDSVPYYLVQRLPAETFPGVRVDNLAGEGCDLLDEPISYAVGLRKETEPWCADLKQSWPGTFADNDDQVFLIFASPLTSMPHLVDGERLWLDDAAFRRTITDKLEELRRQALRAGAEQVQVVNVPCRVVPEDIPDAIRAGLKDEPEKVAEFKDPTIINTLIDDWAAQYDGAAVVDLDSALCANGFIDEFEGIPIYNDFLHYSPEFTPILWKWMLGQVSKNYANR